VALPFIVRSFVVDHANQKHVAAVTPYRPYSLVEPGDPVPPTRCNACVDTLQGFSTNVVGKLEVLDSVSDALAAAQAFHVSHTAKFRYELSMQNMPPLLRSLATTLGLGGMLTLALVYSSVMFFFALYSEQIGWTEVSANMAGLTKTAATLKEYHLHERRQLREREVLTGICKIFGEAVWQVLLQTTLIMATGIPLLDQPLLLVSVALSCITLSTRAANLTFNAVSAAYETYDKALRVAICLIAMPFIILTWGILLLVLVKLYYTEACRDRLWGLSTGCVQVLPSQSQ